MPTARSAFMQCPEGISCTTLPMAYSTLRYQYDISRSFTRLQSIRNSGGIDYYAHFPYLPHLTYLPHTLFSVTDDKKPTGIKLSAISVFPINDSARVQLSLIMPRCSLLEEDLNHVKL
jgi:hypothetical protein